MNEFLNIRQSKLQRCPKHILREATKTNKHIIKITWDKAGGYPEHVWGYVQWSLRPFTQTQGCDGTIDLNVHLIGLRLCQQLKLDYPNLYEKAYSWQNDNSADWLRQYKWETIETQTKIPKLSEQSLKNLLYDLNDINNRSLVAVLHDEFTKLGYNVDEWWNVNNP